MQVRLTLFQCMLSSLSVVGLQLRGVEFSALPSGLHNSSQDVMYVTGTLQTEEKNPQQQILTLTGLWILFFFFFFFDYRYFHLEGCIGVAVFANVPSSNAEDRGAQMVSVGVLVKPSVDTGRCGQVWRHVEFLKSQAK